MLFKKISLIALISLGVNISSSDAQLLKKIQRTLENKANEKVSDVLNNRKTGKPGTQDSSSEPEQQTLQTSEDFAFVPGTTVIFASDFKLDTKGRMAKRWKSSAGGSVVSVNGVPGNWLALSESTTYKIDSLINLPGNFTIEFDLITRSDEVRDIGAMSFGFARDNSAAKHITDAYNDNAITNTQLHFWNKEVINASSDTKKYNTLKYPFANYANGLMHVSIAVEGENMSVYINKSKVLDTKMLAPGTPKFFYLTSPFSYNGQSKVYFGNFVMMKS